jgi:hypothetical protein
MTGRKVALVGAAALLLAAAGLAVRPFVSSPSADAPYATSSPAGRPPALSTLAVDAATKALRCMSATSGAPPSTRGCGRFTVTRQQTICPDGQTCRVDLLGTFAAGGPRTVVALTVTLHHDRRGWRVVEVSS